MGTKYSSQSASGYNASPPSDGGTISESNKTKWSTVTSKIGDVLKLFSENINSALLTHFDVGPTELVTSTTLTASHYQQTIEVSGSSITLTLADASTLTAGWFVWIRNTGASNVTISRFTGTDTYNGSASDVTLSPGNTVRVQVNAAENGFISMSDVSIAGTNIFSGDIDITGTVGGTALNDGEAIVASAGGGGVEGWIPRNYLAGLTIAQDTDTDHDILIAVGEAADSTNTYMLKLATAITKQVDATWAVGDDAGGLFSGTVAVDTTYHIFIIRKDTDGSIDAGFDTSITAANIPTGYTAYRRIASLITNPSSNFSIFTQIGDQFLWAVPKYDIDDANPGTSAVLFQATIPEGLNLITHMRVWMQDTDTAGNSVLFSSPLEIDSNPSLSGSPGTTLINPVSAEFGIAQIQLMSNTSGQLRYRCANSSANTSVRGATSGWEDTRGKDD